MKFNSTPFQGLYLVEPFRHADARGEFVKTFHAPKFADQGLTFDFREEFYSISNKGVLRGMHFQTPPAAHQKIVYCIAGSVLDVVLDLRKTEPTYGKSYSIELNEENRNTLWIPIGFAHGFLSLRNGSCVVYKTDKEHAPDNDKGLLWNSFGFEWPTTGPTVSTSPRDNQHPSFESFESPF